MWPYLVWTTVYWGIRYLFFGNAHLHYLEPPFALWFLFALFFYRYFLKDMVKFKWLLPLSLVMYLAAGQIQEFGDFMALGRMVSYFPFFLLGYYCSKERLAWLQGLKKKPVPLALLGAALCGMTVLLMFKGPTVGWFLLKQSVHSYNMMWWEDTLLRILVWLLASGWIIFMINIIPSKKNFISFIGMNTMPIYVFHLTLRYVIDFYGLYIGFNSCLVVVWFAIISLIHRKVKSGAASVRTCDIVYGIAIAASIAAFFLLFNSGCLASLYGLCPENRLAFYFMVYGGALICGVSFVSPFWIKLYDLLVDGPVKGSRLAKWLQGPQNLK
jgi:fucose 4-O-acetylase-like acetyltransferase